MQVEMMNARKKAIGMAGLALALLALPLAAAAQENSGTILGLVGTGASSPGDAIEIEATVQANSRIQNSSLSYTLTAPSSGVIATRTVSLGRLEAGQTYSDSWSTTNTPDMGTYTVTLCWSPGGSTNCGIASASTSFYSVPTLGWGLSLLALGALAVWLWRRRDEFALERA
jgi:hypothetical protein